MAVSGLMDTLDRHANEVFGGRVVRKDLVRQVKVGANVPVYVLEFLHTAEDDRRAWLPRVRKIASNGKSTIIATVDQMPGAR